MNIASAVGTPLKIDSATLSMYQGLYARVLVDVDVSKNLPKKALASLKTEKKKKLNLSFFVNFFFEKLPNFCGVCKVLGHSDGKCRKQNFRVQDNVRRREDRLEEDRNKQKTGSDEECIGLSRGDRTANSDTVRKERHDSDSMTNLNQTPNTGTVRPQHLRDSVNTVAAESSGEKVMKKGLVEKHNSVNPIVTQIIREEGRSEDGFTRIGSANHRSSNRETSAPCRMNLQEKTNNTYEILGTDSSSEQIRNLFPQDTNSIIRA